MSVDAESTKNGTALHVLAAKEMPTLQTFVDPALPVLLQMPTEQLASAGWDPFSMIQL